MTGARVALALAALLAALNAAPAACDETRAGHEVAVETYSLPFDAVEPDGALHGALEWRGGLELASDDETFGGYSGLVVSRDGTRLLAVSDRGMWLTATILYEDGRLLGLDAVRTAPMLSEDGVPLAPKSAQDAEGLAPFDAAGPDGIVLVALEREERILAYNFGRDGFAALPRPLPLPADVADGPNNKELEAVGRFAAGTRLAGTVIAISERLLDGDGNVVGWLIGGPAPGRFAFRRMDGFDVTDLAILPDGDVLVLERHLSQLMFTTMRIRRIAHDTIAPGALLDGPVLLEASQPRYAIDNMEALAVHRAHDGEVRLTLMSDDNFNALQRTVLLQFALPGE